MISFHLATSFSYLNFVLKKRICDGPRNPATGVTVDDDLAATARAAEDDATPDERQGRSRRPAKPMPQLAEYFYF